MTDEANKIINQRYIDENQTVWTVPTPEAYAKACKTIHRLRQEKELMRLVLRNYKHWIKQHRTEKSIKWIDAKNRLPQNDTLVVLLTDNGRIDIGYKSKNGYWVSHGFMIVNEVTHWMPLPKIEQKEDKNNG